MRMATRKSVTILFKTIYTLYTRSNSDNGHGSQTSSKIERSSDNKATTMEDTKGSTIIDSPAREEQ
jgi:hypothetical protein